MRRPKTSGWQPTPRSFASYIGRASQRLKGGALVEVVAYAAEGYMVVRGIGRAGLPVKFTVRTCNLGEPQPQLF